MAPWRGTLLVPLKRGARRLYRIGSEFFFLTKSPDCLTDRLSAMVAIMPDADAQEQPVEKCEPVKFPVEVTVNGVRVTVTLVLKPGTTVAVDQLKVTTDAPAPPR